MLCKEHFADLALWHAHCHTEVMLELYVDIVIPTWLQFFLPHKLNRFERQLR